jgi:hypothetical protein
MEEAAKNRRWVEFEQLLEIGRDIKEATCTG